MLAAFFLFILTLEAGFGFPCQPAAFYIFVDSVSRVALLR